MLQIHFEFTPPSSIVLIYFIYQIAFPLVQLVIIGNIALTLIVRR